jgi:malonyl-CoA/methylmalonyl-CoA synthetase
MNANLFARLEAALARDPGRQAIVWQGRPVAADELLDRAGRMAAALRALGVQEGDRVAVQVEKSLANVALYLGALKAGAVYLPLNTAYTMSELGFFLGDAEPRVVVGDPAGADRLQPLAEGEGARFLTLDGAGQGSMAEAADAADPLAGIASAGPDDIAAILYTSGTTGRSKGAMLSHDNLWSNAQALIEAWGFTGDDVLIHALPLYHTHGLFVALNMALATGARCILLPRFDADEVLDLMPEATVLMGVPTFYTRLLASPRLSREAASHMRLFVSGSAPLLAETHRAFTERTGHAILERYGMTETCMNTTNPLHGERRPGAVGMPLPGVAVRVVDEAGKPVAKGEIGTIEVKGPNVFKGYWRLPEKTAAEFRPDGFFITGDLGTISEDGYLSIVGRGKDLIISGGFNVYPKEVEDVLNDLPGIAESAVIGVPHPDFGEAVVAVVVPEKGGPAPDEAAVIAATRETLAAYKRPKRVLPIDALPRNTMGKVQKNQLRDAHKGLFGEA